MLAIRCTLNQSALMKSITSLMIPITELFRTHLGEVFHMGGLGGIPFTGKTGFSAYSDHIPDDGNLFILFAPHIGLSEEGNMGRYSRIDQTKDGTACGAACGALNYCVVCSLPGATKTVAVPGANASDFQMEYIIAEVNKRLSDIISQPTDDAKQAALAMAMYDIAKTELEQIIKFNPNQRRPNLFILGGIQINMPKPMPDFFMPCMFELRTPEGETINLMESTFRMREEGEMIT